VLERREEPKSGPEHGSGTTIDRGLFWQAKIKFTHTLVAKLNGEQSCARGADYGGMCSSHGIKNRSERTEFLQPAAVAFQVVAIEHNRDIGQLVLVTRHRTRDRLAQMRQDDIIGADAGSNWRVKLSSPQDVPGLCRAGHEGQTRTQWKWSTRMEGFRRV